MLGDFGVEREATDETFGWFGTELRVHPDLTNLVFIDVFGRETTTVAETVDAIRDLVEALVHPDDVEVFWRQARANRQTQDDILRSALGLVGALTMRPTERPSDSSVGPRSTEAESTASSSSRVALRLLEGRPDLQAAVVMADRERTASAV